MHYKNTIMGITLDFIKKHRYVGSGNGVRYIIQKGKKEEDVLEVWLWPDEVCFEATEDEKKQRLEFPFNNDGFMEALEEIYQHVKADGSDQ